MINNKDVLNFLIEKFSFTSYLEIGVRNCNTFEFINCEEKFAVDPAPQRVIQGKNIFFHSETSDKFFEKISKEKKFDLIFIDGDHSFEFVRRDLENSINHISNKGLIILHDTDPPFENLQGMPRLSGGIGSGCISSPMGECWKALAERRIKNQDIKVLTVKCDEKMFKSTETPGSGCETGMSICKVYSDTSLSSYDFEKIDWKFLDNNRRELLNRVSFEEMKEKVADL